MYSEVVKFDPAAGCEAVNLNKLANKEEE